MITDLAQQILAIAEGMHSRATSHGDTINADVVEKESAQIYGLAGQIIADYGLVERISEDSKKAVAATGKKK